MAKLGLCMAVSLLLMYLLVAPCQGVDVLGVLGDLDRVTEAAVTDWSDGRGESDVKGKIQADPYQEDPSLDPHLPQNVPSAQYGDEHLPSVESETSISDTNTDRGQEVEGQAQDTHFSDSYKSPDNGIIDNVEVPFSTNTNNQRAENGQEAWAKAQNDLGVLGDPPVNVLQPAVAIKNKDEHGSAINNDRGKNISVVDSTLRGKVRTSAADQMASGDPTSANMNEHRDDLGVLGSLGHPGNSFASDAEQPYVKESSNPTSTASIRGQPNDREGSFGVGGGWADTRVRPGMTSQTSSYPGEKQQNDFDFPPNTDKAAVPKNKPGNGPYAGFESGALTEGNTQSSVDNHKGGEYLGYIGTAYVTPFPSGEEKLNQAGRIPDRPGSMSTPVPSSYPAVPAGHPSQTWNSGGTYGIDDKEDQEERRNNNLEDKTKYNGYVHQTTTPDYVFRDKNTRGDNDGTKAGHEDSGLEYDNWELAADEDSQKSEGPSSGSPQVLSQDTDWEKSEEEENYGDEDEDEENGWWYSNPDDEKENEGDSQKSSASPQVLSKGTEWEPSEKEEDYNDEDEDEDDDEWYYNPDDRKETEAVNSSTTHRPFSSPSSPGPAAAAAADVKEDKAKEDSHTSDVHEGVIEKADVIEKRPVQGPKDAILLYTAIIVILIAAILLFTLWRNSSQRGRPRNTTLTVQSGEEGKRLLDHPFV